MGKIDPYSKYTEAIALAKGVDKNVFIETEKFFKEVIIPKFPKKPKNDIKILEVGCGWGRYVKVLQEMGYKNTSGFDFSKDQIKFGKKEMGIKNIQVADAESFFKKSKERFDVILMIDVVEHLEDDVALEISSQVNQKLNKGGVFVIQVPNSLSPMNPFRYADITHKNSYNFISLKQLLNVTGFDKIDFSPVDPVRINMVNKFRFVLWKLFFVPILKIYFRVAVGNKMGGIYTPNIISFAYKK